MMKRFFFSTFLLIFVCQWLASQTDSVAMSGELNEIVVSAIRLKNEATLTSETVSATELQQQNTGVNLPFLLTQTPSLVATSDDGLGIGYASFRVRGTDQTRINMTVNGVPLNDSESQAVFWVNLTDMASSTQNVSLQRGVGTSTNGSSAFGASLDMHTDKAAPQPFATLTFNGGMYNTFRESAKIGTGLMDNGWAFDARFSKVNSDGYIDRAASDLYSYYASAAWYGSSTLAKLTIFGGHEKTYMAWDGISADSLATNRRYNPAGSFVDDFGNEDFYKNQTDNYDQQYVQLSVSQQFTKGWQLHATLHYTHGSGYYEQYKTRAKLANYGLENGVDSVGNAISKSDLVRQKQLANHFYGGVVSVGYENRHVEAAFGGSANCYQGAHWGNVIWVRNAGVALPNGYEYYRNLSRKIDANVYLKAVWHAWKGLDFYGDLQYRHVDYRLSGINDEDLKPLPLHEKFHFFNPKAGVSYRQDGHAAYFNFAMANREPSRKNYTEAGPNDVPKSERLFDYELGYWYAHRLFDVGVNFYFMDYDHQLVLTGKLSDTGAYLTKNVEKSYRAGIEILAEVRPCAWFRWSGNATFSRNKIIDFVDWVDDWDTGEQVQVAYGTTDIAFSPNITAASRFQFDVAGFSAILQTNYVSKQYLDNTQNRAAMLPQYCVTNLHLAYSLPLKKVVKRLTFSVQMNNLFNKMYVSNGGSYSYFYESGGNYSPENQQYTPWFYAQAGFNVHGGVCVEF